MLLWTEINGAGRAFAECHKLAQMVRHHTVVELVGRLEKRGLIQRTI